MAISFSSFAPSNSDDATHDLRVDEMGNLEVVSGIEETRQRVIERLLYYFAEWPLNTTEGVPYRNDIFTRPINAGLASSIISDQIRSVDGVTGVRNVQAILNPTDRRFTYSALISTIYGDFDINTNNIGLNIGII